MLEGTLTEVLSCQRMGTSIPRGASKVSKDMQETVRELPRTQHSKPVSCSQPWFSQSRALKTSNVPKKGPGTKSYLLLSSSFHKRSHGLARTLTKGHRLRVKNANDTRNLKGCSHRVSFFYFVAGQWKWCQELPQVSTFGQGHYRAQDRLSLP